jgi:NADH-quinone oxidoreductase subunit J
MTPEIASFIVLSVATVATAIGVISFRNAVYSALSLILTLLCLAMFYLLLNAMFISIVQVLIYAGAIMVLFLFVVTMLVPDQNEGNKRNLKNQNRIPWQRWVGSVLGLILVGALSYLLFTGASLTGAKTTGAQSLSHQLALPGSGSVEVFGNALFHGYLFPFEVTSLLIVIAILGALIFGRRA